MRTFGPRWRRSAARTAATRRARPRRHRCGRCPSARCRGIGFSARSRSKTESVCVRLRHTRKRPLSWAFRALVRKKGFEPSRSCDRQPLKALSGTRTAVYPPASYDPSAPADLSSGSADDAGGDSRSYSESPPGFPLALMLWCLRSCSSRRPGGPVRIARKIRYDPAPLDLRCWLLAVHPRHKAKEAACAA